MQRILQLDQNTPAPDFSRGSVVGLIAEVGEPSAGDRWPIELEEARVLEGAGWLRYRFASGLFYPVRTAPFLTAAYVPGLRQISVVQVNQRIYRFTSAPPASLRAAL